MLQNREPVTLPVQGVEKVAIELQYHTARIALAVYHLMPNIFTIDIKTIQFLLTCGAYRALE